MKLLILISLLILGCNNANTNITEEAAILLYDRASDKEYDDEFGAIEDLTIALEIDPNFVEAYFLRASINAKLAFDENLTLKDIDGRNLYLFTSIEDLTKIIEIPSNYEPLLIWRLNEPPGSLDEPMSEAHGIAYYWRGEMKYEMWDYYGAIRDFTKAIEIFPEMETAANYYYMRGAAKYYTDDVKGACKDWKEVIDEGVADDAYSTLAADMYDAECY